MLDRGTICRDDGSKGAHDASDRLVYHKTTGALYLMSTAGAGSLRFSSPCSTPSSGGRFHDFLMVA
jgi:hypothetical protein